MLFPIKMPKDGVLVKTLCPSGTVVSAGQLLATVDSTSENYELGKLVTLKQKIANASDRLTTLVVGRKIAALQDYVIQAHQIADSQQIILENVVSQVSQGGGQLTRVDLAKAQLDFFKEKTRWTRAKVTLSLLQQVVNQETDLFDLMLKQIDRETLQLNGQISLLTLKSPVAGLFATTSLPGSYAKKGDVIGSVDSGHDPAAYRATPVAEVRVAKDGFVVRRLHDTGDRVRAGDKLFEIDTTREDQRWDRAKTFASMIDILARRFKGEFKDALTKPLHTYLDQASELKAYLDKLVHAATSDEVNGEISKAELEAVKIQSCKTALDQKNKRLSLDELLYDLDLAEKDNAAMASQITNELQYSDELKSRGSVFAPVDGTIVTQYGEQSFVAAGDVIAQLF